MPKGDFGNKRNTKGFNKNPNNINRKGRKKNVLNSLTEYLEKTYGSRPPKGEVQDMLQYIECLPVEDLKNFIKDPNIPVIIQAYGRLLLSGDPKELRRVQGAELINDRLHGRPKQATEITGKDGDSLTINFVPAKK